MNIPYSLLETQDPTCLRNYLHAFGYLVVDDFFSLERIKTFNEVWDNSFEQLAKENKSNTPTYLGVSSYCEISNTPWFEEDSGRSIISMVDLLVGEDAQYANSSANEMSVPTPWHRDIYLKTPIFKLACYINSTSADESNGGGELCIIPGSHLAGDLYADAIGSCCFWPESGGMHPESKFPRLKASDGTTTLDNYPTDSAGINLFPYIKIKAKSTDLIIFDQRLVHGSTIYRTGKKRRMMVSTFATNPKSVNLNSRYVHFGYKTEDALLELEKWFQLKLNEGSDKSIYQHVDDRLKKILGQKLKLFSHLQNTGNFSKIIDSPMRDNLTRNMSFYEKNMAPRAIPIWG